MVRTILTASLLAAAAMVLAPVSAVVSATDATAHGSSYKGKHSKKYRARKYRRHYRGQRDFEIRRRDRAIFAHEVDLSRPGGPKRFFELIDEESAR